MSVGYYRSPTICGETVVFVSEDDLWTVPLSGGIARRLTANLGQVAFPALSPDGLQLAFSGREDGEQEVYCMPALGGSATRLTYLGGETHVVGWHPDGRILFTSNAAQPFYRTRYLYTISPEGGQPEELPVGPAASITFGPSGGRVIGRNTSDLAHWKRYKGGLTGDLWIDEQGNDNWQRLIKLEGNVALPQWVNDRIYFISDHEGIGNLYSCLPTGNDLQRHTHHEDFYVRYPATDGKGIVYQAGADLYHFSPEVHETQRIEIAYHSPRVQRNRKFVGAEDYLESYNLHPAGHLMVITTRGKPFVMANWEKAVVQQGQLDGVRYRLATWLEDGRRLAIISDAKGEEALEIHYADASAKPERLDNLDLGRIEAMATSPSKDKLALSNHRQELVVVDLTEKTAKVIDHSRFRSIYSFSWSPDGNWLAYSFWNTRQTAIIKLAQLETSETWEVTRPLLRDTSPAFDPDGLYLYFLSYRDFDPVYDNLHFDLSFPWGMRPYLITLQADLPSPFLPVPRPLGEKIPHPNDDGEPENSQDDTSADVDAGDDTSANEVKKQTEVSVPAEDETTDGPTGAKNASEQPPEPSIRIDLEGIQDRIIAFPVAEKRYGRIRGIKGKVLFSSYPITGSKGRSWRPNDIPPALGRLESYDLETQQPETLLHGITDFDVSLDTKTLVYRSGNDLRVLKAGDRPDDYSNVATRKTGWLDLTRIKVAVTPPTEWLQMYREAWRLQRDYFWTSDLSAIDWEQVYTRYLPLVDRVTTRDEFSDLLWEMQGELGTSHAYEFGGDYRPEPDYYQGFLGADLCYDADNDSYHIQKIIQGDVWDVRNSSPLARPGINVRLNDQLVAVNRRKVGKSLSPQALLVNQAGQEVLLAFRRDNEAEPYVVSVKTLYGERNIRYRDWVETNRQYVHDMTNGQIGYVHIPDMGADGYAEFHRGFLAEVEREGLIVDVRFNRGGHVSSLILEKLSRQRIAYDISRWREPIPYPQESVLGPMVALANETTSSDGDIFSHAFKLLRLGPLIGTRTWGGVIGITVNEVLVDGSVTTQPQFSTWFQDVDWRLENYGTDPDIVVEIRPQDYAAGKDPQLQRAVEEIQRLLAESPPKLPNFDNRPRLSLPTLP